MARRVAATRDFDSSHLYRQWLGQYRAALTRRARWEPVALWIVVAILLPLLFLSKEVAGPPFCPFIVHGVFNFWVVNSVDWMLALVLIHIVPPVYIARDFLFTLPGMIHDEFEKATLERVLASQIPSRAICFGLARLAARSNLRRLAPLIFLTIAVVVIGTPDILYVVYIRMPDYLSFIVFCPFPLMAWLFVLGLGLAAAWLPPARSRTGWALLLWVVLVIAAGWFLGGLLAPTPRGVPSLEGFGIPHYKPQPAWQLIPTLRYGLGGLLLALPTAVVWWCAPRLLEMRRRRVRR